MAASPEQVRKWEKVLILQEKEEGEKKKKKRKSGISQGTVKTRRSNELRRRRGQIQKGKKRQDSRGRTSENILANI